MRQTQWTQRVRHNAHTCSCNCSSGAAGEAENIGVFIAETSHVRCVTAGEVHIGPDQHVEAAAQRQQLAAREKARRRLAPAAPTATAAARSGSARPERRGAPPVAPRHGHGGCMPAQAQAACNRGRQAGGHAARHEAVQQAGGGPAPRRVHVHAPHLGAVAKVPAAHVGLQQGTPEHQRSTPAGQKTRI